MNEDDRNKDILYTVVFVCVRAEYLPKEDAKPDTREGCEDKEGASRGETRCQEESQSSDSRTKPSYRNYREDLWR